MIEGESGMPAYMYASACLKLGGFKISLYFFISILNTHNRLLGAVTAETDAGGGASLLEALNILVMPGFAYTGGHRHLHI